MTSEKRILVTGCGRSGTRFMYKLLHKTGIKTEHEKEAEEATVSWHYFNPVKDTYKPFQNIENFNWTRKNWSRYLKFLQIRNPRDSCSSIQTFTAASWEYIESVFPQVKLSNNIKEKSIVYWTLWNYNIIPEADYIYDLDDAYKYYSKICSYFNLEPISDIFYEKLVKQKINSRNHNTFNHEKYLPKSLIHEYEFILKFLNYDRK